MHIKADLHLRWDRRCILSLEATLSFLSILKSWDWYSYTLLWTCTDIVAFASLAFCRLLALRTSLAVVLCSYPAHLLDVQSRIFVVLVRTLKNYRLTKRCRGLHRHNCKIKAECPLSVMASVAEGAIILICLDQSSRFGHWLGGRVHLTACLWVWRNSTVMAGNVI